MRGILHAIVNSGATLSGIVDLSQVSGLRALQMPVVTSGHLFVQGATMCGSGLTVPLSADLTRLQVPPPNSGDVRFATDAGSKVHLFGDYGCCLPPFIRLQFANAQTDTRTITLFALR